MARIGPRMNSPLLAPVGMMISFISSFRPSAIGCSRPMEADAVGADAHLHVADDLAFGVGQIGDAQHQRHDDGDDLDQRPDDGRESSSPSPCRMRSPSDRLHRDRAEHRPEGRGQRMAARRRARSCPAAGHRAALSASALTAALAHRTTWPLSCSPSLAISAAVHARHRQRRIERHLQRGRAAHHGIGLVDRHLGDALQPIASLRLDRRRRR